MATVAPILAVTGNEAVAEAMRQINPDVVAAYPITPQTEIPEYLARRLPEVGGVFLQAEGEVAQDSSALAEPRNQLHFR